MTDFTPTPEGGEVRANTTITGDELNPSLAALPGGGYVLVWTSDSQDGNGSGIIAQRFAADGTKQGGEFQVNTTTDGPQTGPSISAIAGGGFVIVWQSKPSAVFNYDVLAQRYDANGVAQGVEFLVNSTTTPWYQHKPTVAGLTDGNFLITWEDNRNQSAANVPYIDVYGRLFDASGAAMSGEIQLTPTPPVGSANTSPNSSTITALVGGGFALTWYAYAPLLADEYDIYVQRFDGAGNSLGSAARVNTSTVGRDHFSDVAALADGGFAVSWTGANDYPINNNVYVQRFNASGAPQGSETLVNTYVTNTQESSVITGLADGGFVVSWTSMRQEGDDFYAFGTGVYAQRFGADGVAIGNEFIVNETTSQNQLQSLQRQNLGQLVDGSLVATWGGSGIGDGYGVFFRQFALPENGPVNSAPIGTDAAITFDEDTSHIFAAADFGFIDPDVGDALAAVTVTILPGAGTLALNGVAVLAGARITAADIAGGLLTFAPTANANGNGYANLLFKVEDQDGALDPSANTLTFNVTPVDEPDPYNGVTIIGTAVNDTISASKAPIGQPKATALNDKLYGFDGDDSLDGSVGGDLMTGGNGNDKYTVDNAADVVVEQAGATAGTKDLMQSSKISFTLADNVENGTLTGSLTLGITGNALDNQMTGNVGANSLYGFAGKDKLTGKAGVDHLYGGTESDTLSGDEGDDMLYGEDGADSLNGGLGSDTLDGGAGADKFTFDANALIGGAIDTIEDFSGKLGEGDKISLAAIDANGLVGDGNSKFAFIGLGTFTGAGAQVRYFSLLGDTVIEADINGDMIADLTIILTGGHTLQLADFSL